MLKDLLKQNRSYRGYDESVRLTREQLLDNIWGFDFNGDSRVVDTSIKRIRKKLPEDTDILLKSVYGVGYKAEVRGDA